MPTPDESSEPDRASKRSLGQRYKDRQRKEGRGRQGEKHKARGKQSRLRSAQGTEPSREMHREASGAICFLTPCHPTSLHWVRSTKDRPRRPFPSPSQPITLCCKPITLFSQPPTPTPDNTHRALNTHTHKTHVVTQTYRARCRHWG